MTLTELTTTVSTKALLYLTETDPDHGLTAFPSSIVDFVIEYAISGCHFPNTAAYTEAVKCDILKNSVSQLAMACNEVYSRAAAEGQTSHGENGISRVYDSSWVSPKLFYGLPNFASAVYTTTTGS